jgi:hypothetical protein
MAETGAGEPAAKRQRVEPKPKVILGCGKICWPLEINPTVMRERAIEGKAKQKKRKKEESRETVATPWVIT